jgi:hypothetical protein
MTITWLKYTFDVCCAEYKYLYYVKPSVCMFKFQHVKLKPSILQVNIVCIIASATMNVTHNLHAHKVY